MIYLVSNNQLLFNCTDYNQLSVKEALKKLSQLTLIQLDTETLGLILNFKI